MILLLLTLALGFSIGISIALAWAISLGRYEILYPSNSPWMVFRSGGCQLMNSDVLDVLWAAVTRGFPEGPKVLKKLNHIIACTLWNITYENCSYELKTFEKRNMNLQSQHFSRLHWNIEKIHAISHLFLSHKYVFLLKFLTKKIIPIQKSFHTFDAKKPSQKKT